jgi:hypothetical protein
MLAALQTALHITLHQQLFTASLQQRQFDTLLI